jgi:hypothetical protein
MGEALLGFVVKLVLAAVLTPLVMGGFALFGHHIVWWLAALIALVAVFGGWLIVVDDGDHSDWFS